MKILTALMLCCLSVCTAVAQTADWLLRPQYSAMEYFGPQMYKVMLNDKVGIVNTAGKVIVPVEYDAINLFYEGRTVFVDRTQQGWLLKGTLSTDGTVNYATDRYYLLPQYMFYSEGFLPVRNEQGLYGYLNEQCQPAFKFGKDEVKPFSEGFAVVGDGDTFRWMNTDGEEIVLRLPNGGTPYGGTNYYNGTAYLWDEEAVMFCINSSGETRKLKDRELMPDYLYRIDSDAGAKVPYTRYEPEADRDNDLWQPDEEGGLWTFTSASGHPLTVYQYDALKPFANGSAPAQYNGRWGLVQLVGDKASFASSAERRTVVYSPGSSCKCSFKLSVPEKWKGHPLAVTLRDEQTGQDVPLQRNGSTYAFSFTPEGGAAAQKHTFAIEVKKGNELVWQGRETYTFTERVKLKASIRVNNSTANASNRCGVTATVRNPSSIPVTTTITLSGGGQKATFATQSVKRTIPAHGVVSVQSSFLVQKVELAGWCAVSTSDGASARQGKLQLRPNN